MLLNVIGLFQKTVKQNFDACKCCNTLEEQLILCCLKVLSDNTSALGQVCFSLSFVRSFLPPLVPPFSPPLAWS